MPINYTIDSTINTNWFSRAERYTYNQLQDWVNTQIRCEYLYKSEEVKKEMHREEFVDKNPELDAFLDEYKRKEG